MKASELVTLAVAGGVGYLAWKLWRAVPDAAAAVADHHNAARAGQASFANHNRQRAADVGIPSDGGRMLDWKTAPAWDMGPQTPAAAARRTAAAQRAARQRTPDYPGGVNYPARPGAAVGYQTNPFIPDVLKRIGQGAP